MLSVLLLAASAATAQPCLSADDNASMADWRRCMVDYNERLNLELEQAWRKAVESAAEEDDARADGNGIRDKEGQSTRRRNAQIAWHRFRTAQCDAEAYRMFGGTGSVGVEQSCFARLTRARIDELKLFVSEN